MPAVLRILPFALVSTALHAVVLVGASERLDFAVTPPGAARSVSVELVPAGPLEPDPATQDGVAGSASQHLRNDTQETAVSEPPAQPEEPSATEDSAGEFPRAAREPELKADSETPEPTPESSRIAERTAQSEPTDARRDIKPRSAPAQKPAEPKAPPEPARDSSQRASAADSGADGAAERAQLAARAREEVAVHFGREFRYPRIARQRGWEGRVVLAFRVHADGAIKDIELVESSGHVVLDEAARQSLERIERVPVLADRLDGAPLTLEIPVTYRLQSG